METRILETILTNRKIMKKLIFTLAGLLLAATTFAGNSLTLKSGDASVLSEKEDAVLVIDYSNTKVEGKTLEGYLQSRGDDFVRDWPEDAKKAKSYFVGRYNKKSKGLNVVEGSTGKYKMIIHVADMDMGNAGSSFIPMAGAKAGGVIMNGTLEIVDAQSNKQVCEFQINKVKGVGHMSETVRIGMMYFQLATDLTKFK